MKPDLSIIHQQARLDVSSLTPPHFYLQYDEAIYRAEQTDAHWWQRTMTGHQYHWLRLRGRAGTSPAEALDHVLMYTRRPRIPLPALLVAYYLAQVPQPDDPEARRLFRWVALAVDNLLQRVPTSVSRTGGMQVGPDELNDLASQVIDALLAAQEVLPWPKADGASLQLLVHLSQYLWSCPPELVRRFVATVCDLYDYAAAQQDLDDTSCLSDADELKFMSMRLLGQLSALAAWGTPPLTVRGLPVRTPALAFLAAWPQALLLVHPDAPPIEDDTLAWLCNGMLNASHDEFFLDLPNTPLDHAHGATVSTTPEARITLLAKEADAGTYLPVGQYALPVSPDFPVLSALGVTRAWVAATPQGYWVRLSQHRQHWGMVVWWCPQIEPPISLSFALHTQRGSTMVVLLHETLWQVWRNLRVTGSVHD